MAQAAAPDDRKPFTTRTVRLRSADGWFLSATLYRPAAPIPEAVLLLHRYEATSAAWSCLAEGLAAHGYSVVTPDLRGRGASAVPPPGGARSSDAFVHGRDALTLVRFLQDSLAVPNSRIVLGGDASGAAAVIWAGGRLSPPPHAFLLFDPLLTIEDALLLPILRGLDLETLVVAREEATRSLADAQAVYLALPGKADLWQEAGAGRAFETLLREPPTCERFAADVAGWIGRLPAPVASADSAAPRGSR